MFLICRFSSRHLRRRKGRRSGRWGWSREAQWANILKSWRGGRLISEGRLLLRRGGISGAHHVVDCGVTLVLLTAGRIAAIHDKLCKVEGNVRSTVRPQRAKLHGTWSGTRLGVLGGFF